MLSNSLVGAEIKSNLLDISYTDSNSPKNKRYKVYYTPDSRPSNPCYTGISTFFGVWDYIWFNQGSGLVYVQEIYPKAGRVWTNLYTNNVFNGWTHTPVSDEFITVKHTGTQQTMNPAVARATTYNFNIERAGYKFRGIAGFNTGNTPNNCGVLNLTGPSDDEPNKLYMTIRNFTDEQQIIQPSVWCLYSKEVI